MFSNLKSSFGTNANNSSFGFSGITPIQPNPFGQPAFGKPSNTSFTSNTSAFGSTPTPLFGSPQQHGTNLFGSGTTAFGQQVSSNSSFGSSMFGSPPAQQSTSSLFGSPAQSNNAFGQQNKTTGFGFGATTGPTGFFGQQSAAVQPQQTSSGLFGSGAGTTSLFGSPNQGFGAAQSGAPMGTVIKFQLVTGTDTMVKGSINQTISTRHHCITCMKEYEGKSLEELRWEDYQANRKGPQQGTQPAGLFGGGMSQPVGGGLFGTTTISTSTPLFGPTDQNKSVFGSAANTGFGQTSTGFGQPVASSSSTLFGKPLGGFGSNTSTSSAFTFNPTAPTPLFGGPAAAKPPFGAAASQPNTLFGQQSTGFGTQPTGFGTFGSTANQNTSLFGQNKTTPFNMGPTNTTAFGAFNQTNTQQPGSMFQAKPNQPFTGFGTGNTTAPLFSQQPSFGQPNQSLFNSSFNKPQTNLFGQPNPNPVGGANLSLGTGANLFGNKPLGTGNMFGQTGGMFNTGFNTGMNNTFMMPGVQGQPTMGQQPSQNPNQINSEEQLMSMVQAPFGINSHLNSYTENKLSHVQDLLRPTNPLELKQLLNQVNSPNNSSTDKLEPKQVFGRKVPIFDGLEQRDEEVENFKMNSPNPRRLLLRNKDKIKYVDIVDSEPFLNRSTSTMETTFKDFNTSSVSDIGTSTQLDQEIQEDVNNIPSMSTPTTSETTKKPTNVDQNNDSVNIIFEDKQYVERFEDAQQSLENSEMNDTFDDMRKGDDIDANEDIQGTATSKEPHPTGIICTRPEYYTKPTLDELVNYIAEDGSCVVQGFTIGRIGYGNVRFSEAFDVSNLNIDELVFFRDKEINIYPDESKKPPLGQGLNRKAQVTLDKVWPYNKKKKIIVKDINVLVEMDYAERLRKLCEKQETRFVDYRPETGSWVFKVEHFSKYGHRDSDDSDIDESSGNDVAKIDKPKVSTEAVSVETAKADTVNIGKMNQVDSLTSVTDTDLTSGISETDFSSFKTDSDYNLSYASARSYANRAMFHLSNFDIGNMLEEDSENTTTNYYSSHTEDYFTPLSKSTESSMKSMLISAQYDGDDTLAQIEDELLDTDLMEDTIPTNEIPVTMIEDYYSDSDLEDDDESIQEEMEDDIIDLSDETITDTGVPDIGFKPDFGLNEYRDGRSISGLLGINYDREVSVYEYTTIYEKINTLPWSDLSFSNDSVADIMAFKGRSFKVGWGKNFTLASTSLKGIERGKNLAEYGLDFNYDNTFSSAVHIVQIIPGDYRTDTYLKNNLNAQLLCQLNNSEHTRVGDLPYFKPKHGFHLIDEHKILNQTIYKNNPILKYNSHVWNLCHALFGEIKNEDMYDYDTISLRRKQLSNWLSDTLKDSTEELVNSIGNDKTDSDALKILAYLSANRLDDAGKYAMKSNYPRLSIFISQIPCPENIKSLMVQQLTQWQNYKELYLNENVMKIYMLLAGIPAVKSHEKYINVCESMDWIRSLAVYFWYVCAIPDSIPKVMETYEEAFTKYACAARPSPHYDEYAENVSDLIYHLLKFYCNKSYPLQMVLNPINHTSDELDYSLSWFLMQMFSSLNLNSLTDEIQEQICLNYASQLESMDLWHWAIFVLLFINNNDKRIYHVKKILWKHVEILCTASKSYREKEKMLVKHFHLPSELIDSAKADKAISNGKYNEAVHYLKYSKRYTELHKYLFSYVTPDHIICYKYEYIGEFLKLLSKSSKKLENWSGIGEFILHVVELSKLFNDSASKMSERGNLDSKTLRRARSLVITINSEISQFPQSSYLHSICATEICSRVLEMINGFFQLTKIREQKNDPQLRRDHLFLELKHAVHWYVLNTDYINY